MEQEVTQAQEQNQSRTFSAQGIIAGLKFLCDEVFSQENISTVREFVEHIESFSQEVIEAWNAVRGYIEQQQDGDQTRSLELEKELREAGLEEWYRQIKDVVKE